MAHEEHMKILDGRRRKTGIKHGFHPLGADNPEVGRDVNSQLSFTVYLMSVTVTSAG